MNGVLPDTRLKQLIADGAISAETPILPEQIQPASLDLRLGSSAWRLRASFLCGRGRKVSDRLADFEMHRMDLTGGGLQRLEDFPHVGGVVHTHSTYATAWAARAEPVPASMARKTSPTRVTTNALRAAAPLLRSL